MEESAEKGGGEQSVNQWPPLGSKGGRGEVARAHAMGGWVRVLPLDFVIGDADGLTKRQRPLSHPSTGRWRGHER